MKTAKILSTAILCAALGACALEDADPIPPANPELGKADRFSQVVYLDDGPQTIKVSPDRPALLKGKGLEEVRVLSLGGDTRVWTWGADRSWSWSDAWAREEVSVELDPGPAFLALEALDGVNKVRVTPVVAAIITEEQIEQLEEAAEGKVGELLEEEGYEHEDDVDVEITNESDIFDLEFKGVMTVTLKGGCPSDDELEELEEKAEEKIQEMLEENEIANEFDWDVDADAECEDGVLTITVTID